MHIVNENDLGSLLSREATRRARHGNLIVRTARTVAALILREISTAYGRSPGGYLWAVLDPVLGISLLSLVFSQFMRSPALGTNFPLFYATGYLPFVMYNDISGKMMQSLRFSRPFLAYPTVTFFDVLLARLILNFSVHLVVFCIVISGISFIYHLPLALDFATIAEALLLIALFAAGIGTLNCFLIMRFPLWERAWQIATRPLFIVSGVFFLYEAMPHSAKEVLWYNPLVHLIGLLRRGAYGTYDAPYVDVLFVVSAGLLPLLLGLLLLLRYYRDLLER